VAWAACTDPSVQRPIKKDRRLPVFPFLQLGTVPVSNVALQAGSSNKKSPGSLPELFRFVTRLTLSGRS
jgi:hypothetical protein